MRVQSKWILGFVLLGLCGAAANAIVPPNPPVLKGAPVGVSGTFRFATVPEISFVKGYAETENLGIWHMDTSNRWAPGDLENLSKWRPRVATTLQVLDGSLSGVTYDASTAELRYDGRGGAGWARVKLVAAGRSVDSEPFYVRVLAPKAIWGKGATTRTDIAERFPGVPKFDQGSTAYATAWAAIPATGSEHNPDVLLVLSGTYPSAEEARLSGQLTDTGAVDARIQWKTGKGLRPWFYLIGEPGARPKFSGYDVEKGAILTVPGYQVSVVRNIEIETMVTSTSGGGWVVGVPNRKYWSKIYAHDTHALNRPAWPAFKTISDDVFGSHSPEGDTTDSFVRGGVPVFPNDWKSWFWGNRFLRTGGSSLKHTIYLHGRPDAWLIYNNNLHNGGNQSSAVKATVGHYRVLNSRISAFADDANPADPTVPLNQQLLDVPSASDVVIYNNHLIGGRRVIGNDVSGTRTGLIWFNPRRSLWGTDVPRYPEISFQAAPFQPFSFTFTASLVKASSSPGAIAEIRPRGGAWRPLATAAVNREDVGREDFWVVTVKPEEVWPNGPYEVRMNGGASISPAYVLLTSYRNDNYLAVTSFADGGLDTMWYKDGPRAYLPDEGQVYWTAIRGWGGLADGRASPTNPYTLKKYVAYNRFVWNTHPTLDDKREEAIRDNGSYPSTAIYTGSAASRYGAVPPNWVDPGVTFLLNNVYEGWRVEDMGTEAWLRTNVSGIQANSGNSLYGPGQADPAKLNWPHYFKDMPTDRQPLILGLGGERTPATPLAVEVPLPEGFRLF